MLTTEYSVSADRFCPRDTLLFSGLFLVNLFLLLGIVVLFNDLLWTGLSGLSWEFLSSNPALAGRSGGIAPVLFSTALVCGLAVVISLPISIGSGFFLLELGWLYPRITSFIRSALDVLAAVPSIVFGLFGNALFSMLFGFGYSILAGAFTLACMILPLLIRITDQALLSVADGVRHPGMALNLSSYRVCLSVYLPAALPSLLVGFMLGLGRALSETAALLFTSGYSLRSPESLFDPARVLSVHIYDLSMNVVGGEQNAYTSAVVLVLFVAFIGGLTTLLKNYIVRRIS